MGYKYVIFIKEQGEKTYKQIVNNKHHEYYISDMNKVLWR